MVNGTSQPNYVALVAHNAGTTLIDIIDVLIESIPLIIGLTNLGAAGGAAAIVQIGVALVKRGAPTNTYARHRLMRYAEEMHAPNLELEGKVCHFLWKKYLARIPANQIGPIFVFLDHASPAVAVTFRETSRQAKFSGYTNATMVLEAMRLEVDFAWDQLIVHFQQEWADCNNALITLNNKEYAGWVSPLQFPSKNYRHLSYIGWRLLKDVRGIRTLGDYMGLSPILPDKVFCDAWVDAYILLKAAAVPQYPAQPGVGPNLAPFINIPPM